MKKERVKAGFQSILPFIYSLLIQIAIGSMLGTVLQNAYSPMWLTANVAVVLFVAHLAMTAVFGLWYINVNMKRHDSKIVDVISIKSITIIVMLAVGLQFAIKVLFMLFILIMPNVMNDYQNLMQSAGIGSDSILTFMAAVILAPIGEECIFRGMTVYFLEKTGAKFWLVNIIQALLFGIMHGNLVQSSYAFLLGLVLGYVAHKYASLFMSILLHLTFNIIGISGLNFGDSIFLNLSAMLIGVILFIIGMILCKNEENRERPVYDYKKKNSFMYYKAFTPKLYRVLVHIVFPALIIFLGTIIMVIDEYKSMFMTTMASLLLFVELFGDYVAFGASSSKDASPINWMKSSNYGRKLLKHTYLWDEGIRIFKFTLAWGFIGLYPLLKGEWQIVVIAYMASLSVVLFATLLIRRIDLAQMTVIITMPAVAITAAAINYLPEFTNFIVPIIVVLGICLVAAIITSYVCSMRAFEKSYHDAVKVD